MDTKAIRLDRGSEDAAQQINALYAHGYKATSVRKSDLPTLGEHGVYLVFLKEEPPYLPSDGYGWKIFPEETHLAMIDWVERTRKLCPLCEYARDNHTAPNFPPPPPPRPSRWQRFLEVFR